MRAQRAGRFSGGDDKPKVVKPLPPLRERINPTAKGLNEVDELERQLEREYGRDGSTMEADEYFELKQCLDAKREALDVRSKRLRGVPVVKPSKDAPVVVKRSKTHYRPSRTLSSRAASWIVFVFVIGFLYLQKH